MKSYYKTLTIAGSDSGGGAGIQADLKTFAALGCFGMSAITALTAQNTTTVTAIHPVPPEFIGHQMDAVMEDIGSDAIKIGMLHSPETIDMVAKKLKQWQCKNIVLDPVMISTSGQMLLSDDAIQALKSTLIPIATIITPNLPEASVLLGQKISTLKDMDQAVRDLSKLGCDNILLKGGHLDQNESCDYLYMKGSDTLTTFPEARIATSNSHGTGCTLSSAICANLAKGVDLVTAVGNAKTYITKAITAGAVYKTGKGHGPLHHFHEFW